MSEILFDLRGISFAYDRRRPVLENVDFRLHAGERIALDGANGAGKTTMLHIMVGLLKPQSGQVFAFGRECGREADFHDVRAQAGLLFQDSDDQLFCPSVAEDVAFGPLNLGMGRDDVRRIVAETLDLVGLPGFQDRITYKLSGGQKRLIALASVLAMRPKVLLLDEPANGLDAQAKARLLDVLAALPQAMVIVSHDEEVHARLAIRRAWLEAGCLGPACVKSYASPPAVS